MNYLHCFAITYGVSGAAAAIMLAFGVLLVLLWLTALLLENTLLITIVLALSALHGLFLVLSWLNPLKARKSSMAIALPAALMFFEGGAAHGQTPEVSPKSPMPDNRFVFPLSLNEEPMERLLVASFKDDPEYEGIEPQLFDNNASGKGLKILMYRKDKKVDVYYEPGVCFDEKTFTLGEGLGYTAETKMSPSQFAISESGVDIDIAFRDKSGRNVKILIKENTRDVRPFPFLAPVGDNVKDPAKLFAVYMKGFDFVRRNGTTVHVTVGDRELTPANFPITRDRQKVYLMRYASSLVIGEINASVTKPYVIENISRGVVKTGDMRMLINEGGKVQSCWIDANSDTIELRFPNGFPNLLTLPQNREVRGSWQYAVSGEELFGGTYSLLRDGSKVCIELDVTKNWKPRNIPFSFRVFTGIVRMFRTWPASYRWNATVDLNGMSTESKWQRK